jgi:hypothetical protein
MMLKTPEPGYESDYGYEARVTSVALSESLEQRKKLAKALTVVANSEQHERYVVLIFFAGLKLFRERCASTNSARHSDMNEATSNGR